MSPQAAPRRSPARSDDGRRIIAVGTTTTRTLESVAKEHGGRVQPDAGETSLFIYPGFHFQVAGRTAHELPPAAVVAARARLRVRRPELVLDAYRDAVKEGYRFYSYGDAMLVV